MHKLHITNRFLNNNFPIVKQLVGTAHPTIIFPLKRRLLELGILVIHPDIR